MYVGAVGPMGMPLLQWQSLSAQYPARHSPSLSGALSIYYGVCNIYVCIYVYNLSCIPGKEASSC